MCLSVVYLFLVLPMLSDSISPVYIIRFFPLDSLECLETTKPNISIFPLIYTSHDSFSWAVYFRLISVKRIKSSSLKTYGRSVDCKTFYILAVEVTLLLAS